MSRDITARKAAEALVASQAAKLAEQAQQLRELATRDELTGLLNRRGFFDAASNAIESTQISRRQATMFFVDLDDLKQINDNQGHLAGDRALTVIAHALADAGTSDCLAGRIGGDEFCLFQTATQNNVALDEDTIQKALAAAAEEHFPGLSATVGRVDARPDDDLARLISRSDEEMYSRKARRGSRALSAQ